MTAPPAEVVVILNPKSGSGSHGDTVRQRADELGYALAETDTDGDAVALAAAAAERGVSTLVAAGGDGTVNEVIRGIRRADAFDRVTLGVVPAGTGNNFAKQLGIADVATAFDVVDSGERRRIDVGLANGHLFVNSCVAGLTADSSSKTSPAMKQRFGVLAYVVTTLRTVSDFESLRLSVAIDGREPSDPEWTGDALAVLIGNARKFGPSKNGPANVEDGLFDVAVIDDVPVLSLMSDAIVERLLGRDSAYITRFQARSLAVEITTPSSVRFSLDGEIIQERALTFENLPRTLSVAVGERYGRAPD
jgi:YegS/Rv2252/BmrU family lipid kinase